MNNGIAMLKLDANFTTTCKTYKENYIFLEKYTTSRGFYDVESISLGKYLSGYSGNYGIRFDECGWGYQSSKAGKPFPEATGISPIIEHALLTGQTVTDGPELTTKQTLYKTSNQTSNDGYTSKGFTYYPQFLNISIDIFRKILDKTIRIPRKEEVIARTKIAIVNDISSGSDRDKYSTPQSLFTGLYSMDGEWDNNNTWLKKTGRYPTIPIVFKSGAYETGSFNTVVNKSAYSQRWPNTQTKVNELNMLFPSEYSGDIYTGRMNNSWITYHPYLDSSLVTKGTIPLKYNSCDSLTLSYSPYSTGLITEYGDKLQFYLNNYRTDDTQLKTDVIKIYGSSARPGYQFSDRGNHSPSSVTDAWSNGIYTVTITHNGPLELTIYCSGTAINRRTDFATATIIQPTQPAEYSGDRQYEAENFEYKNIASGDSKTLGLYTAMGYLAFGKNASASIRIKVNALKTGAYQLRTRYSGSEGDVTSIDLLVNGVKIVTPTFTKTTTDSTWMVNTQTVNLKAGANTITYTANTTGSYDIYFDNIIIASSGNTIYDFSNDIAKNTASNPPAEMIGIRSGSAGVVSYNTGNATSNVFKAYTSGYLSKTGVVDLNLFPANANYSVTWKEYYGSTGGKKGILLRASGSTGSCPYATGMREGYLFVTSTNNDNTVSLLPYVATSAGISPRQSYTSSFSIGANTPCWYRATAIGNTLKFECSKDSITWEGGSTTTFADNNYTFGDTQLLWGLGMNNYSWVLDNISYQSAILSSTKLAFSDFNYNQDAGPSLTQNTVITGQGLKDDVVITVSSPFEISLSPNSGFSNSLNISPVADSIVSTTIYLRLKEGLVSNNYLGTLSIRTSSAGINKLDIPLKGTVKSIRMYSFDNDIATTNATIPPAAYISVSPTNGATAGVTNYTGSDNKTSNVLKSYTGGARNQTGVLDLNLFTGNATDYSVVWKQNLGSATKDYKIGVLLRGNTPAGTSTTGYVQGLQQGYLFNVYNIGTATTPRSDFRIYRSTNATSLTSLISSSVSTLTPATGQNIWYRASISGTSNTTLKFEYSTDSLTWNLGASTTDVASSFSNGATQFVWGLGTNNQDFYIDNITQQIVPATGVLTTSETNIDSLSYTKGSGPSLRKSFNVSGMNLMENVLVSAPTNFEISLNETSGYSPSLIIPRTGTSILTTTVYVRLKSGLNSNSYQGEITFSYANNGGSLDKTLPLKGAVTESMISFIIPSSMNDLGYVVGSSSIEKVIEVTGSGLSQDLIISAPANFELSLSSNTNYESTLNLTPVNGTIAQTQLYVRLKSGLTANTYSGTISLSSIGLSSKTIDVLGSVSQQANISVSETEMGGFDYNYYSGVSSPIKTFDIFGGPISGDIIVTAPEYFEISLGSENHFVSTLILQKNNGAVLPTTIYVRLKSGLTANTYIGTIKVASDQAEEQQISVSGKVSWTKVYDFENDIATTFSSSPPANNITIGNNNSATAGVVSYTDATSNTSNRFRAYSGGNRNSTGIADLNLFPNDATDYAVTWKQIIGSDVDYKIGCLLRGNGTPGTATTGYVQGILNGYVFIVYRNPGSSRSEFRVYKSTSSTSLTSLVNIPLISLYPVVGQSVWYRASVTGNSPVNLKFEYSTDSLTWNTGATASDNGTGVFTSGSTQLVWGLAASNYNFFLDNIDFKSLSGTLPVNMASFTVKAQGNQIQLNWHTYSEFNNAGFDIERSIDGVNFKNISFVSGTGMQSKNYRFIDISPERGKNYYRLKQTDFDGKFNYSDIKTAMVKPTEYGFLTYPNPVSVILNVKSGQEHGEMLIFDMHGRIVIKAQIPQGNHTTIIDVSSLPSGLYVYRLNSINGSFIKK